MDINVNLFDVSLRGQLRMTGEEKVIDKMVKTPNEKPKVMADAVEYSLSADSPFQKVTSINVYKANKS